MSVIVEFSIFPLDKGESLSPYVARALNKIQESGLPYWSSNAFKRFKKIAVGYPLR